MGNGHWHWHTLGLLMSGLTRDDWRPSGQIREVVVEKARTAHRKGGLMTRLHKDGLRFRPKSPRCRGVKGGRPQHKRRPLIAFLSLPVARLNLTSDQSPPPWMDPPPPPPPPRLIRGGEKLHPKPSEAMVRSTKTDATYSASVRTSGTLVRQCLLSP